MTISKKRHEQLQEVDLTAANAIILQLQQKNATFLEQLFLKSLTTDSPLPPSGNVETSFVPTPPRNPPKSQKRPLSPNNTSIPQYKVAKPKLNDSQLTIAAVTRQFSSPSGPTGYKFIHVPIRCRYPIQQLRSSLRKLHINTSRILDIQYPDRNVASLLIHRGYESELRAQLSKFSITVRDDFDPLDPVTIRDPAYINKPIDSKKQHACHVFLSRLCTALRRFKTPLFNAVSHYFIQSGLLNLEILESYDLAPPYKHTTGHILDHTK